MRKLLLLGIVGAVLSMNSFAVGAKPNIVFILADDMGYGSVQANNPKSPVPTPHLDRLVEQGMNFTDAHTDSSVCTPTRYGLLTGRYSWRSGLKSGVTWRFFPSLIEPETVTVADMLRGVGYQTAMIGKWHLGIDFINKQGQTIAEEKGIGQSHFVDCADFKAVDLQYDASNIDFSQPYRGGPTDHGFDYFFGENLPNMPPYAFFENDRIVGNPSVNKPRDMFGLPGPMVPGWTLEAVMPTLTEKASQYIRENADNEKPFFLYFALPAPHTPIAPSVDFQGISGINKYADWLMETDWSVGEVMAALEEAGIADNTLLIFSTDNGTSYADESAQELRSQLDPQFKGAKRSIYEGGHRVPYIVRWPGVITAGSSCGETIGLNDFMATAAEISGAQLSETMAVDSHNILPLYLGKSRAEQPAIIHRDFSGGYAIRQGDWKMVFVLDRKTKTFKRELYNLKTDIKETSNVIKQHPEVATQLSQLFETKVTQGRSTPGSQQSNFEDPRWMLPF